MNCFREANVTIRWLMLHKKCKDKKYSEIIEDPKNKVAKEKDIVRLLLLLSKFEL
jgi:Hereditary spastic paraplegia protein strumpellin